MTAGALRIRRSIAAILAALGVACGGGESTTKPVVPQVQSVVITAGVSSLLVGESTTLLVSALDAANAVVSGQSFTWQSSSAAVATVTSTGVVTGVGPGSVVISASAGGRTGSVSLTVAPVPPRNFSIVDAQFTQGVQSVDGSIPIILGTKPAVVNVMIAAAATTVAPRTQIVLRLFGANGALVRTDTALTETQFNTSPSTASPSVQFLVPANLLQTGMRWQVVRDPRLLVTDTNVGDDVFPRTGTAALNSAELPPLIVKFVPIMLGAHGNSTASLSVSQLADFTRTLESAMPVSAVSVSIAQPFASQSNFGPTPRGGDLPFWSQLLTELDLARMLDTGDPRTYWMGVVIPPSGFNFAIYGGIGYVPINGAQTGARTRTTALVGPGWYTNPTGARDGVAHELGHNFGRLHAPCGAVSASFDVNFPNAGGLIGTAGHDVYSWWKGLSSNAVVVTADAGDVMGYCQRPWASPYTYDAALRFRQQGFVVASHVQAPRQPVLIVQGSIDNGQVTLQPAFTATANPTLPQTSGPYRLDGIADDGRVLFSYTFAPAIIDHAPNIGHFTFALPLTAELQSSLVRLRVSAGKVLAERVSRNGVGVPSAIQSLDALSNSRGVTVTRTRTGAVAIACADKNAQGILVQDSNNGGLLATNASNTATLSARTSATVLVQCSDGVRTTSYSVSVR